MLNSFKKSIHRETDRERKREKRKRKEMGGGEEGENIFLISWVT